MREFVLLALKAETSPDFNLDNLPDAGRMDLVCRTISNTLLISNHIRDNTIINVVLNGPKDPPKIISFYGNNVKNLEPDEKTIARFIKNALKDGLKLKLNEEIETSPGIKISKKSFETLIKEKSSTSQLIYLHPKGEDLRKFDFEDNVTFIFGDYIGLPKKTERLLDRLGAKKISIGPVMLFASHCSVLVHNELDRRINKSHNASQPSL